MRQGDDYYTRLAKERGYPARSVFKLEEMQKRFKLVKKKAMVLDLGCSPGSWSLFLIKHLKARVVGVDLREIKMEYKYASSFEIIAGDLFEADVLASIMNGGPYDVILSDAAPSTTGNRSVDAIRSYEIVERVIDIASICLKEKGNLVAKVFQGGEQGELLGRMRALFDIARTYKPSACRRGSFEVYLIGLNYYKITQALI